MYNINRLGKWSDKSELDQKDIQFYLLENQDLHEASNFATECFYASRLKINNAGMTELESKIWAKVENIWQSWGRYELYLGNYLGFLSR